MEDQKNEIGNLLLSIENKQEKKHLERKKKELERKLKDMEAAAMHAPMYEYPHGLSHHQEDSNENSECTDSEMEDRESIPIR
jgi:hypothetical protein